MVFIGLHLYFSMKLMTKSLAESWVGGDFGDLRVEEEMHNSHLGSRLMNLLGKFSCQIVLSAH